MTESGHNSLTDLFTELEALANRIDERALEDPQVSYTAALLSKGQAKCGQKFGEEAIELVIEAVRGDRQAFVAECVDVFYHLLVLMKSVEVDAKVISNEIKNRRGTSGLEEKASRN